MATERSAFAQKVHGLRAKLYHKQRYTEKAIEKKTYAVLISSIPS
jgi:hypothetical protein